jgi:hypothetical protein
MRQHVLPSLGVPAAHSTALFADENKRLRRRERKSAAGVPHFKAPQKFSVLRLQRSCPVIASDTLMSKQVRSYQALTSSALLPESIQSLFALIRALTSL